jgi:valyl-tRNA synthetase
MRSVKKNRTTKKSTGIKVNLSGNQAVEIVNTAADVIKSGFNWLNEMEKTKQIAIDAQVRITESNNRLASELASFEKDILKIKREYELESKKLDNEYNLKMRQLDLIERLIDKMDKIEIEIKIYQEKDGLTSPSVMALFEQLHQQKLSYMNNLVLLGQN